jgi:hypothetical protein
MPLFMPTSILFGIRHPLTILDPSISTEITALVSAVGFGRIRKAYSKDKKTEKRNYSDHCRCPFQGRIPHAVHIFHAASAIHNSNRIPFHGKAIVITLNIIYMHHSTQAIATRNISVLLIIDFPSKDEYSTPSITQT